MYFYHLNRVLISKEIKIIETVAKIIMKISRKNFEHFNKKILYSVYKQKMIIITSRHCDDRKPKLFFYISLKTLNTLIKKKYFIVFINKKWLLLLLVIVMIENQSYSCTYRWITRAHARKLVIIYMKRCLLVGQVLNDN